MRAFLGALAVLAAAPAGAEPEPEPTGTFAVASRVFLVGEAPTGLSSAEGDILDLTEVGPLRNLVRADPLLGGAESVSIVRPPYPLAAYIGPEGVARDYPDREGVPPALRAEGYVTAASGTGVPTTHVVYPDVPAPGFVATCDLGGDFAAGFSDFCSILATYPPDPAIMLAVRLPEPVSFAEPHQTFARIADRMREVATCLDVTDARPADPQARLRALLAEDPGLTGCGAAP